ncbi:MAG: hypothetical protein IPH79_13550 [Sphingomonadales bacterium]|nr:hypothetical protein [Sphingomonadales bacterium]
MKIFDDRRNLATSLCLVAAFCALSATLFVDPPANNDLGTAAMMLAFVASGVLVIFPDVWRLTTRTLPSGKGDIFDPKPQDFSHPRPWKWLMWTGMMLGFLGKFLHLPSGTVYVGFCLFLAGGNQLRRKILEVDTIKP